MSFHTFDNWRWDRNHDGSVTVQAPSGETHIMPASTWASVVASMSKGGEVDGRYYAALDFHGSRDAETDRHNRTGLEGGAEPARTEPDEAVRLTEEESALLRDVIDRWDNGRAIAAEIDDVVERIISQRLAARRDGR